MIKQFRFTILVSALVAIIISMIWFNSSIATERKFYENIENYELQDYIPHLRVVVAGKKENEKIMTKDRSGQIIWLEMKGVYQVNTVIHVAGQLINTRTVRVVESQVESLLWVKIVLSLIVVMIWLYKFVMCIGISKNGLTLLKLPQAFRT